MSIGIIDAIALTILIFSILFALYRGLVTELLGISSWILAGFGAVYSYTPMQKVMQGSIENEKIAGLCGSALVALGILVIMTLINAHINQKLRQSSLSGLDRILGMIFGIVRAVLLMALLYMAASVALSEKALIDMEKENVSMVYIRKTVVFLKKFVPKNVQDDLGLNENDDNTDGKKKKKIGTDLKHDHKLPEKSHKKAIKNLVDDIKPKKEGQKAEQEDSVKAKPAPKKEESSKPTEQKPTPKTKTPEKQKAAEKAKPAAPKPAAKQEKPKPAPKPAPMEQLDKKGLDNMVEQLMEKGM